MTPHVSLPGMMRDERLLTPKINELFKNKKYISQKFLIMKKFQN